MNLKRSSLALITIGFITILTNCQSPNPPKEKYKTVTSDTLKAYIEPDTVKSYCGQWIHIDLDRIDTFQVPKNSVFINLFDGYQTNDSLLNASINAADSIFKIHKIIAGKPVNMIYREKNGVKMASHLIYHATEVDKLVLGFKDSAYATWYKLPVDTVERSISANITNTLYHSILDAGVSYELGIKLSEVFAWQVNFFRIDRNDFFKVVFDEYQADGKTVDIGNIKAALFYHRGDSFYAFRYNHGKDSGYFDEHGDNLRKAFLKAPLKYSRISSRYTKRRFHPVQKRWKAHLGTDYAAPTGTPIRTVGDGYIVAASYTRGNGRFVKVKHNSTYTTQYLHMSRIASGIKKGARVTQGQVIGYVGSTGLATGPHLCFRFWQNGVQVDPFKIKAPPSTPVSPENKDDFSLYASKWMDRLNSLQPLTSDQSDTTVSSTSR